jgi:Flp pilus assembly protein TadD
MKTNNKNKSKKAAEKTGFNRWLAGAVIALAITFAVFIPTVKYEFTNWDDDINIYENENVTNFDVKGIFTERVIGNYNPLSNLSMAIDYRLADGKPWLLHLNNVLLHLATTLLVFIILKRMGLSLTITFLVTLLFGIHPLRVESVVWVTERKDVLFGFFYLLSLLLYIEYHLQKRWLFFALSMVAFVFSLLSKIQAVSLPLSILLVDYWFDRKFDFKTIAEKIPYFIGSLITGLAGVFFLKEQGSLETGETFPLVQRLFIGSYSFMVYIIKSGFPLKLSALHPYPANISTLYYLSMIPAIAIAAIPVLAFRKNKFITFGLGFFIVNIVFLLQVVGAGQGFLAERFTYIAYIGLFVVFAFAIEKLVLKFSGYRNVIYGGTAVYMIVLIFLTIGQRNSWRDNITLWNNVIDKYPKADMAYNNLGHHYRQTNNYDLALENYNIAIQYNPKNAMAYNNRGKIYFDRGKNDLALADYNNSLKYKPDNVETLANRGAAYGVAKQFDEALVDLNRALELNPNDKNTLSNRGFVYYQTANYQKTIDDYTRYLQLKPNDTDIMNTVGLCYLNLGNTEKAIEEFHKAISINPKQGAYYMNRSLAFIRNRDKTNALNDALKAQQLGFQVNPAYIEQLKMTK